MFSSILPGTDNLFKYLLTIGFVLLFFAVVYPLQKEQELKIEELDLLMETNILNYEISTLDSEVNKLIKVKTTTDNEVEKLKSKLVIAPHNDSILIIKEIEIKKLQVLSKIEELTKKSQDLKRKNIQSDYKIQKHEELGRQIDSYFRFKLLFLGGGVICIILGFRFWLSITYLDEIEKCKNTNPPYTTSFLRIRIQIRKFFKLP